MVGSTYSGAAVLDYQPIYDASGSLLSYKLVYDYKRSYSLDLINNFVYDDKRHHALQAALVYRNLSYGVSGRQTPSGRSSTTASDCMP